MTSTVGFAGLGIMGSAMSGHVLGEGFPVVGYDPDARRIDEHRQRGGSTATSVAEIAENVDVIVTSLPSTAAFHQVLWGDRGLLSGARDGLIVVETSTLPLEVKSGARRPLAGHGVTLLDCPLSGTGAQARDGDIVVYVSGDEMWAKERITSILDTFARAQYDTGEFGNGTKMKIVANLLVAIHNVAAAEALLLAGNAGLDSSLALRALGDGAGGSRMLDVRGPLMVGEEYDPGTMRVEVFQKDLEIIGSLLGELGSPAPVFAASRTVYDAAMAQGRAAQDTACVRAVLEQGQQ